MWRKVERLESIKNMIKEANDWHRKQKKATKTSSLLANSYETALEHGLKAAKALKSNSNNLFRLVRNMERQCRHYKEKITDKK